MNSSRNDDSLKNLLKNLKNAHLNSSETKTSKLRSESTCSASSSFSKTCQISKNDVVQTEKQSIQHMIKSHPLLIDLSNSKQRCKLESENSDIAIKKFDSDENENDDYDYEEEKVEPINRMEQKLNHNNNCLNSDEEFTYKKMISKTNCSKKLKPKQIRAKSPCKIYLESKSANSDTKKFNRSNRVFYNGYLNKQEKCYENMPEYQSHASELLQFLKSLWSEKKMCDLYIEVCGRKYPAHKLGLAMFSKKYREEFQRKANESVYNLRLKCSTTYAVEAILNYIYTAKIDINPSNVEEISNCAKELAIDELIEMTNDYMSSLSIGDILDYMGNIINKEGSEYMFYELYAYFMTHLDKISRTPEFLKSSISVVNALLSDSHLCVCKELDVFEACLRWIDYDKQNRTKCLAEVLKNVRYTLMCPDDLVCKVESTINMNDIIIFKQVYLAYKYHALSTNKVNNFSKREENRNECLKGASVPDSFVKAVRELSEIAHKLKAARAYTSNKILD